MNILYSSIIFLLFWLISISASLSADTTQPMAYPSEGSYAVVVSSNTFHLPEWKNVVDILRKKHEGAVVVYSGSVHNSLSALRTLMPRYTCFVAQPEEAGRNFVVDVHRLTRKLDEDPYTDTIWGIFTGYDVNDALRIARRSEPLVIRRGLCGTSGVGLGRFTEGMQFDEGRAGGYCIKHLNGSEVFTNSPADSTKDLVTAFNEFKPDIFYTSGHGTEHGWQIGYNYKDGFFQCRDGTLYGKDTQGKEYPIHSPNVKVYMPVGNCLVGHIPRKDCFALALMHTGGVYQMFGYTAVTFFGYMGWGIDPYFSGMRDRYTLAQSFFCNNQALVHELVTTYPDAATLNLSSYDYRSNGQFLQKHAIPRPAFNLLWDRDAVAFYGDPAWEVRYPPGDAVWQYSLIRDSDTLKLSVRTVSNGSWGNRPPLFFMQERLLKPEITGGRVTNAVVTDMFILLPLQGAFTSGTVYTVTIKGKPVNTPVTSSNTEPVYTGTPLGRNPDIQGTVPGEYLPAVNAALDKAGDNAEELIRAIKAAKDDERKYICFLIAWMPEHDLRTLDSDFILGNIRLALKARTEFPWCKSLPEDMFMNYVLPYANVTEKREPWREKFLEQFRPVVSNCTSAAEAAVTLNRAIWKMLNVRYSARPARADQSPSESIRSGIASCTGLSILLANACRAVGVPARLAGIPLWPMKPGNHSWVEIWDGDWYFTGAAEPDKLNKAWFTGDAAQAVDTNPVHAIYAVSYKPTGTTFPCAWAPDVSYVHGENVTGRYAAEKKAQGQCPVRVLCYDKPGGKRIKTTVTVLCNGTKITDGITRDESKDLNDILEFNLEPGKEYILQVKTVNSFKSERTLFITNTSPEEVKFYHADLQ
jgi:hypothetical protein